VAGRHACGDSPRAARDIFGHTSCAAAGVAWRHPGSDTCAGACPDPGCDTAGVACRHPGSATCADASPDPRCDTASVASRNRTRKTRRCRCDPHEWRPDTCPDSEAVARRPDPWRDPCAAPAREAGRDASHAWRDPCAAPAREAGRDDCADGPDHSSHAWRDTAAVAFADRCGETGRPGGDYRYESPDTRPDACPDASRDPYANACRDPAGLVFADHSGETGHACCDLRHESCVDTSRGDTRDARRDHRHESHESCSHTSCDSGPDTAGLAFADGRVDTQHPRP
jgi:hypothetical protein